MVRQQNSAYLVCPIGRLFETCLNFKLYSDSILSFKPLQCWAKSERSAVRGLCSRWEFLMKASCPPIWTQRWSYWLYLYLIYFISILPLKTAQKPDHHVQSARHLNKNLGTSLYSERWHRNYTWTLLSPWSDSSARGKSPSLRGAAAWQVAGPV